ncbi:MAG TPA: glycosyltransferase family 39 protein, partial [Chthoniobacterales bacterium]
GVAVVPMCIVVHHWLTMNAFEPLIWLACAWCVARAIDRDQPRYFIWFGVLVGLGLENKYTTGFFAIAVVIGLALSRWRRFLLTREFWLAVAVAALIFAPNFIWLVRHHFPFLELMHNIRQTNRDIVRSPLPFVLDQIQILNPVLAPLWIAGLVWLLRTRFRALGFTYLVLLVTFIALRGKNYYLAPVYPILFAASGRAFEKITLTRARWTRPVYIGVIVISTALLVPIFAPILSPETFIAYQHKLGIEPPKTENQNNGPLPQYFADEFGWEDMVRETARVFHALPPNEQSRTAIFANGYGEAAAVDFFGPRYGLPKSISGHQSYWLWGPGDYDGSIMIILRSNGRRDREHFATVEKVGRVEHPYSRRDEWFDIFLCRDLKTNLHDAWPTVKHWD